MVNFTVILADNMILLENERSTDGSDKAGEKARESPDVDYSHSQGLLQGWQLH